MENDQDTILRVEGISKSYKTYEQAPSLMGSVKNFFYRKQLVVDALRPISFTVRRGDFLGVLGPNGAGKTTTLKILTGLISPTTGKATAFSKYDTSRRIPAYLREIGMVMGQRQQLLPDLPAMDSFYLSKALYGIEDDVYKKRLDDFLELLNVKGKASVPVRKLSLGERMKMELILAMLHHPKILFLDEPTIGLDFQAAKIIREFLLYMNKEFKMTILLTSHYTKDIEELCQRVLLINHGQMVYDGPLSGMDDRIYGQRIVDLRFKTLTDIEDFRKNIIPPLQAQSKAFVPTESGDEHTMRFLIPTKDSQELLSQLLLSAKSHSFADIVVGEQALDEIFTDMYKNTKP